MRKSVLFIILFTTNYLSHAQKLVVSNDNLVLYKQSANKALESKQTEYKKIAMQIWDNAEVGFKEIKSSALLQQTLQAAGFEVKAGIAGMPTAFEATYGSGQPVIAILAEYDALPGFSQTNSPEKESAGKIAGQACGHHLFGTASVAAGIEIKNLIAQHKISGTIKIFGCPAEEGGSGKVYLTGAGVFNKVDIVLHWHPADNNGVTMTSSLANKSAKFRFYGLSAHAAASPERGRSALDAVEAMDNMVNMMREHVPQETRIHYVITNGGKAPNVVPDFAEVYYYVRHPKKDDVISIFERVVKAAQGAALGTETKMEYEIIGGVHDLLLNRSLAELMQKNLEQVGGVTYTKEEIEFAKKIASSFTFKYPNFSEAEKVKPLTMSRDAGGGSTDVGDVSYTVPTVGLRTATWVPGTPAHSWQAVASGGTDIAIKGMMVAAKTLSMTAIDLFTNSKYIDIAKEEFIKAKGDYKYAPLLGDRKPALNYRD